MTRISKKATQEDISFLTEGKKMYYWLEHSWTFHLNDKVIFDFLDAISVELFSVMIADSYRGKNIENDVWWWDGGKEIILDGFW